MTKDIIIGTNDEPKQYGIIGKTNNKTCYIDLNAPHIVFVCGKMGSGKGYTIGVITEMLARRSISGISKVDKPATIVVLYKPKANESRSEFYSIIKPNCVKEEVDKLKSEYGIEPIKLFNNDELMVFIDPNVYNSQLLDKFKEEYNTNNIYPLNLDPSGLGGEEWGIILASGGRNDTLYIKRIFKIIEDLSLKEPQRFNIDMLMERIENDRELNANQKRLARSRLDILKKYLKNPKDDIVSRLTIGGINIIDLRYTIRTPDDDFAVLTLVLNVLIARKESEDDAMKRLEDEPFVFVLNEAHQYFRGGLSDDFVDRLEYLIRKKRHVGSWLLLDTHELDDIDDKIIKFSDTKIIHFMDKLSVSKSKELHTLLNKSPKEPK